AFLASSDGHDSNAGEANVTRSMRQMAHYAGSGRVAVFADSLSRAGVFDAIHDRRCYATTGAPILLSFSVNGAQMGEVLSSKQGKLAFRIHTICPEEIERISIYRNTELIERVTPQDTKDYEWCIEREAADGAYYAEVVQRDHEYAWSSPILYRPEGGTEA
ncbi:MAG: DUF3604 domain-containing protein, partial [Oscillospiraceae bacterium]|nr:DUF3604 domain-containing protein [Oscillospiraceae bacterium]